MNHLKIKNVKIQVQNASVLTCTMPLKTGVENVFFLLYSRLHRVTGSIRKLILFQGSCEMTKLTKKKLDDLAASLIITVYEDSLVGRYLGRGRGR